MSRSSLVWLTIGVVLALACVGAATAPVAAASARPLKRAEAPKTTAAATASPTRIRLYGSVVAFSGAT